MLISKFIKENKLFPLFLIFFFIAFSIVFKNITNTYSHKYILEFNDNVGAYLNQYEKAIIISSVKEFLKKKQIERVLISKHTEMSFLIKFEDKNKIDNEYIKNYNLKILNYLNYNKVELLSDIFIDINAKKKILDTNTTFQTILSYKKNQYNNIYKKYINYKMLLKKSLPSVNENLKSKDAKDNLFNLTKKFDELLYKINLLINEEELSSIIKKNQTEAEYYKKLVRILRLQKQLLISLNLNNYLIELDTYLDLHKFFKKTNNKIIFNINNSNLQNITEVILKNDIYLSLFLSFINHDEFYQELSKEEYTANLEALFSQNLQNKITDIEIWKISFLQFERSGLSKIIKYSLILIYSIILSLILTRFVNNYKSYLKL